MTVGFVRSNPAAMRNPTAWTYASMAGTRARSSARRSAAGVSPLSSAAASGSARSASMAGVISGLSTPDTGDQPSKTAKIGTGSRRVHVAAWSTKSPTGTERGTVECVVLLPHPRHVIDAPVEVSAELLVVEGGQVDGRELAVLRDRARLRLIVPVLQGAPPDAFSERGVGQASTPADLGADLFRRLRTVGPGEVEGHGLRVGKSVDEREPHAVDQHAVGRERGGEAPGEPLRVQLLQQRCHRCGQCARSCIHVPGPGASQASPFMPPPPPGRAGRTPRPECTVALGTVAAPSRALVRRPTAACLRP